MRLYVRQLLEQEENEMKPHKHADLIHAWADGAEIQTKDSSGWRDNLFPLWADDREYRIKPAEKVVRWLWAWRDSVNGDWCHGNTYMTEVDAHINFSDFDYKKLEWSREEFDE